MLDNVRQNISRSFPRMGCGTGFGNAQKIYDAIQTMNISQTLNFSILLMVLELVNLTGYLAADMEKRLISPITVGITLFLLLLVFNLFYCEHIFRLKQCGQRRRMIKYHTYVFTALFSLFCLYINYFCLKNRMTVENILLFYLFIAAGPFYTFAETLTAVLATTALSIPSLLIQGAPMTLYCNLFLYSFISLFLARVRCRTVRNNLNLLWEVRDEQIHLQNRADNDPLTHILNRSGFSGRLDELIPMAVRHQIPVAVIMVDIDYFKQYNDTYGHMAGDECLKKVAEALASHIHQEKDLICRFGGEEFQILLYGIRPEDATLVSDRLRQAVADLKIPSANQSASPYVTISVGVCCCVPLSMESFPAMVQAADDELYLAKNQGKNIVSFREM